MAEDKLGPVAERLAEALAGLYGIEGEIGRGGMGIVYSARDVKLRRRVAIKVLPPELAFRQEIRKRFLREAQTAARLSHPHIVPIHTVGEAQGLVYFIMGYVDGESLAARLRRRERLPAEEVRRIMKETADALGLAHAMSVIHRDIKPDNILLEGTRRRVMVTDFGIAKALSDVSLGTLTGTGVAIGTPAYMSPEQAAGEREIDSRSDIYSLGVVGYEMLTGQVPFKAPTVAGMLMKQITEPVPDIAGFRTDCPEDLASTVIRCLEKDAEDRWPTADSVRRALENRSVASYRPRSSMSRRRPRPSAARGRQPRDREWWDWFDEERSRGRPRPSRPRERERPSAPVVSTPGGEPDIVRKFRANFASYVSVNGGLLLMNVVTGIATPWFLFPAIGWGIGLASQYGKLWSQGYSMRDVLNRPPAPDSARSGRSTSGESRTGWDAPACPACRADLGRVREAGRSDSANAAGSSSDDTDRRAATGFRAANAPGCRADRGRSGGTGGRPRPHLTADGGQCRRRRAGGARSESCVLAVQNVRFDLLRLRSAGVAAVLNDLTSATQQARALKIDVEAAIDAADEIKQALGKI
jgi:serine/threonine-protein kinase